MVKGIKTCITQQFSYKDLNFYLWYIFFEEVGDENIFYADKMVQLRW